MKAAILLACSLLAQAMMGQGVTISPDQLPIYPYQIRSNALVMVTVWQTNAVTGVKSYRTYTQPFSQFVSGLSTTNYNIGTNGGGIPLRAGTNTSVVLIGGTNVVSANTQTNSTFAFTNQLLQLAAPVQTNNVLYIDVFGNINYGPNVGAISAGGSLATYTNNGTVDTNLFTPTVLANFTLGTTLARPPKGIDFYHASGSGFHPPTPSNVVYYAQSLATNQLPYGYKFMQLDDSCFTNRDANGNLVPRPDIYPLGFTNLCDQVHALGCFLGGYTEPNLTTAAGTLGSDPAHLVQDAIQFANWGFDYVKFDSPGTAVPRQLKIYYAQLFASVYFQAATNRQVWVQFDGYATDGTGNTPTFPKELGFAGRMRSQTDIGNAYGVGVYQIWHQLLDYFDGFEQMKYLIAPHKYLDSENALLGWGGSQIVADSQLAMIALYHASVFGGVLEPIGVYPQKDKVTTNSLFGLVIDDAACLTPRIISSNVNSQVFVEPLVNGDAAIVILNRDTNFAHVVTVNLSDIGLGGSIDIREVYSQSQILQAYTNASFSTNLQPMQSFFGIAGSTVRPNASSASATFNMGAGTPPGGGFTTPGNGSNYVTSTLFLNGNFTAFASSLFRSTTTFLEDHQTDGLTGPWFHNNAGIGVAIIPYYFTPYEFGFYPDSGVGTRPVAGVSKPVWYYDAITNATSIGSLLTTKPLGTNTFNVQGNFALIQPVTAIPFKIEIRTIAPTIGELNNTNAASLWLSNGFLFVTQSTNGTSVTTTKIGL